MSPFRCSLSVVGAIFCLFALVVESYALTVRSSTTVLEQERDHAIKSRDGVELDATVSSNIARMRNPMGVSIAKLDKMREVNNSLRKQRMAREFVRRGL